MRSRWFSRIPIYVKVIVAGIVFILVVGGLVYLFMSRHHNPPPPTTPQPPQHAHGIDDEKYTPNSATQASKNMTIMEFSQSLQGFSFNFFDQIRQVNMEKNLIISPISIGTSLAMVRMGAEGETATEIDTALNTSGYSADSLADNYLAFLLNFKKNSDYLRMANKIYINMNYELQKSFTNVVSQKFLASAEAIDFTQVNQAANDINIWVENETNHLISNIVAPEMFNTDTMAVLLSAIHFQDEWNTQFDDGSTKEHDFYIDNDKTVKVQMMHKLSVFGYDRFPELDANMVRLPYKNTNFAMVILLPNTRTGLQRMLENLQTNYTAVIEKMKLSSNTNVDVYLPKFKAEFEVELNESLKKMGMKQAFYNGEFQKMINTGIPLLITKVIHKAFIDVDEVGTKAAAATGTVTESRSLAQGYPMICDHPFFYMIVDSDFIPIFQGVVEKF